MLVTSFVAGCTWLFVFVGFVAAAPWLPLPAGSKSGGSLYAMASLTATLMMARSPASCLAVLREANAHGEYSSLVLAVTIG